MPEPATDRKKKAMVVGTVAAVVVGGAVIWAATVGDVFGGDGNGAKEASGGKLAPGTQASVEYRYLAEHVTVKAGDPLVFVNRGKVDHTFTADDGRFDSGVVHPGGTYKVALDGPRVIEVHCEIHPSMHATVTVLAPGA